MTQSHILGFVHRYNHDSTIDSICRECFITIGTAGSGAELEILERKHHCDSWLIDRYKNAKV